MLLHCLKSWRVVLWRGAGQVVRDLGGSMKGRLDFSWELGRSPAGHPLKCSGNVPRVVQLLLQPLVSVANPGGLEQGGRSHDEWGMDLVPWPRGLRSSTTEEEGTSRRCPRPSSSPSR